MADKILIDIINDRYVDDPYTYYIYVKGYYEWAIKWSGGDRERLKLYFNEANKIITQANELYPQNKKISVLKDTLFKAILMTAVDKENVNYPVLFSDQ